MAIAKTAWFVLCLISCFPTNNLIVLLSIYYCLSTFQMSQRLLSRCHCVADSFTFLHFAGFQPLKTGKPRHGWGLSYKVFSRSFFSTQTVCWVKNKLCVCSKLGNAATSQKSKCLLSISANTRIGEYLDFDTIRFQQYQITFRRPHVTSMQLKLAPDEKSKKINNSEVLCSILIPVRNAPNIPCANAPYFTKLLQNSRKRERGR